MHQNNYLKTFICIINWVLYLGKSINFYHACIFGATEKFSVRDVICFYSFKYWTLFIVLLKIILHNHTIYNYKNTIIYINSNAISIN